MLIHTSGEIPVAVIMATCVTTETCKDVIVTAHYRQLSITKCLGDIPAMKQFVLPVETSTINRLVIK